MAAKKYVQALTQYLAGSGVIIGATTATLASLTDIYGNAISNISSFGDKGYITFEPDTTNEEAATFTSVTVNANGTVTLGGLSTVLAQSPYTETSGLVRQHSGGTKIVITDNVAFWATFANKNNNETITGTWTAPTGGTGSQIATATDIANAVSGASGTATNLVNGTLKLSIAAAVAPNPVAVGANNSNSGTAISGSNNVEDVADTSATSSPNKLVRANASGLIDNGFLTNSLPTGSMTMYAAAAAPTGWQLCDGSSLLRAGAFAALFAIIGTTYGSADGSHFNVPDLRGRVPVGVGTGTGGGTSGTGLPAGGSALTARSLGSWLGEETHTQTAAEVGTHTHTVSGGINGLTAGTGSPNGGGLFGPAAAIVINNGGSSTPFNVIQPVMGVNFIIKT